MKIPCSTKNSTWESLTKKKKKFIMILSSGVNCKMRHWQGQGAGEVNKAHIKLMKGKQTITKKGKQQKQEVHKTTPHMRK